ncbi:hypothetical protein EDB89DRAFT_2019476 [Lactarius sanguifluus]|nr:hypothetical protein EDB89DRAFT_2019476 [Lactarius sanguifluus]
MSTVCTTKASHTGKKLLRLLDTFSPKEGGAQVRLKIGLGMTATATTLPSNPPPLALTEPEMFKAQLTTIISNKRCAQHVQTPISSSNIRFNSSGNPVNDNFHILLLVNMPDLAALHPNWSCPGGKYKIAITPQLVHDIFDEYPVVAKAYDDVSRKVPTSKSLRPSIRSTVTQHVIKDDAIFDKYLEKPDDELEPRKPRDDEDHEETRSEEDNLTMQAGKQCGALPLIRKINEHSERLLKSHISTDGAGKRRRLDSGDASDVHVVDLRAVWQQMKRDLEGWQGHLAQLKTDREAAEGALAAMTQNVAATWLDAQKCQEEIFNQMCAC